MSANPTTSIWLLPAQYIGIGFTFIIYLFVSVVGIILLVQSYEDVDLRAMFFDFLRGRGIIVEEVKAARKKK